jgi:osmotically-inducible protein OsmY
MKSDSELQHDIEEELTNESDVNVEQLDVQVYKGTVKLTGTVSSDLEKWKADDAVRRTPGITDLVNEIQVIKALAESRDADVARPWFPSGS